MLRLSGVATRGSAAVGAAGSVSVAAASSGVLAAAAQGAATTGLTSDRRASTVQVHDGPITSSEAFVETLVAQGVTDVFGIVGSAFMDSLDLFPAAGIRFISTQHEQGAGHMADGYSRVSPTRRHGVCTAQNGPGITNFVTSVAAAYWAHSPVVCITPEAGSTTKGHGGFQETDQMPIFSKITKYQAHVHHPSRMAEQMSKAFDVAAYERGPVQINIPRDYFYYNDHTPNIPVPNVPERGHGSSASLDAAVSALAGAKRPVLLAGGGVVMSESGVDAAVKLAEALSMPACTTYLHNDAFPASHELACGPLGYQGSQAAMNAIAEADVVLALGTRMNPFGTLPQYGIDYWPKDATLIQVEADSRRLGLTKPCDVAIHGDAAGVAAELVSRLQGQSLASDAGARRGEIAAHKAAWEQTLDAMTNSEPVSREGLIKPRQALRELAKAMPADAMVGTDIGNINSVANSYLSFDRPQSFLAAMTFGNCGYSFPATIGAKVSQPHRPAIAYQGEGAWGMSMVETMTCVREKIPVTAVVFNNRQWGAEKKNQVLWFGDRYVGVQLENPSFADIARSMGAEGITVENIADVGQALEQGVTNQMEHGKTTIIEVKCSRELGDPFRRDAMSLPVRTMSKYADFTVTAESPTGQPVDLD